MRSRFNIQAACVLNVLILAWAQLSHAQSVNELSVIQHVSEVIHAIDEDKNLQIDRLAPGAIATWADFHEGVEVFVSSVGAVEYNGYWVEGLERTSTRAFVIPMGSLSTYVVGDDVEGKFTYWSPHAGNSNKDFSEHLQFSPNGEHSYYEIYEDGAIFGVTNTRRIELPHNAISPMIRNDGSVTYIVRVRDGVGAIFVDEQMVSPEFELEAFSSVINTVSDDGSGYLYGIALKSGGWFLKNGEPVVVEVGAPIQFETLSPDGSRHAFAYETDGTFKVVVDDQIVGTPHNAVSPVVFSRDSLHWHYFGAPEDENETAGAIVTSDGIIPNISDARQAVGYIKGDARPTFIAKLNGMDYVHSGQQKYGPYNDPRVLKFSSNYEHFSYVLLDDEEAVIDIVVDGRAQNLSVEGEYLQHLVSDRGELYHYEKIGEEEVAFRNGREIAWFSDITTFGLTEGFPRLFMVGIKPGSERSTVWVEGVGELFTADTVAFLETGELGLLAAWVRDDGKSYLTLEDKVIGSFDEILYDGAFVADFTQPNLSIFARAGREILQVSVPVSFDGIAKIAGSMTEVASSALTEDFKTTDTAAPSQSPAAATNSQADQNKSERLLRQKLAEQENEIETLKASVAETEDKATAAENREQNALNLLALAKKELDALINLAEAEKARQAELIDSLQQLSRRVEILSSVDERHTKSRKAFEELIDPTSPSVVRYVQKRLIEFQYDPGDPDGKMGEKTRLAIDEFAFDHGLALPAGISLDLIIGLASSDVPAPPRPWVEHAESEIASEADLRARAKTIASLSSALSQIELNAQELAVFIDEFENTTAHLEWDYSEFQTVEDLEVYFCFSNWHSNFRRPLYNAFRNFASEYKINQHLFEMFDIPASVWKPELDRAMNAAIVTSHLYLKDFDAGELHVEQNWDFQAEIGNQIWPHLDRTSKAISDYLADTTGKLLEFKAIVRCI